MVSLTVFEFAVQLTTHSFKFQEIFEHLFYERKGGGNEKTERFKRLRHGVEMERRTTEGGKDS